MRIQSISSLESTKPTFRRVNLNKIPQRINKGLTTWREMDEYSRGIIAALVLIAGLVTAAIIKDHKADNSQKVRIEAPATNSTEIGADTLQLK